MCALLDMLLKKGWIRIVILISSPFLGGIAAFFATFIVCGILDVTAIFPDAGEVGWVFCFITVPVGMAAMPIMLWRYIKRRGFAGS